MIETLMKLLATKSVASNFFGRSSKVAIVRAFDGFLSEARERSFGVNEKKATSAPDNKAAQNSNTKIAAKPMIRFVSEISKKAKLGGSGSKSVRIN